MSRYGDSIIVVSPLVTIHPVTGNEARDWEAATDSAPVSAAVHPVGTSSFTDEVAGRRQVVISRWAVHCDIVAVKATERVRWDGGLYDIDGEIGLLMHRGVPHHLEFTIEAIRGLRGTGGLM